MGGAFGFNGHNGNMSHFAEFNIYSDPHAADIVMQSSMPITILPLDVTNKVQITAKEVANTNDEFLKNISKFYIDFSLKQKIFHDMAVHDALTIAYLVNPHKLLPQSKKPCRVITSGIAKGQTVHFRDRKIAPNDCSS